MRAVDTNVLVRLIVRDDARQTAAAESFIVTSTLLIEACLISIRGSRSTSDLTGHMSVVTKSFSYSDTLAHGAG
jgi:hypothetical protein